MTCGGIMNVPVRKGKTIVAYCIAQCKRHGGNPRFDAVTPAFGFLAQVGPKGDRR